MAADILQQDESVCHSCSTLTIPTGRILECVPRDQSGTGQFPIVSDSDRCSVVRFVRRPTFRHGCPGGSCSDRSSSHSIAQVQRLQPPLQKEQEALNRVEIKRFEYSSTGQNLACGIHKPLCVGTCRCHRECAMDLVVCPEFILFSSLLFSSCLLSFFLFFSKTIVAKPVGPHCNRPRERRLLGKDIMTGPLWLQPL